jgi:hypothetical protein
MSQLSDHPNRSQGSHRERSSQSLCKRHGFIEKPFASEMSQGKRIRRQGNSIDALIVDIVGGVGAHDGRQKGPCPEQTSAESRGFGSRRGALIGATPDGWGGVAGYGVEY